MWSFWGINIPCDELMAGYRASCLSLLGRGEWVPRDGVRTREAEKVGMQTLSGNAQDVRAVHAVLHVLEKQAGAVRGGDA